MVCHCDIEEIRRLGSLKYLSFLSSSCSVKNVETYFILLSLGKSHEIKLHGKIPHQGMVHADQEVD